AVAPGAVLDVFARVVSLPELEGRTRTCGLDETSRGHALSINAGRDARRTIDELRRDVLQEARRQIEVGATPEVSPKGMKEIEAILGAGHADISQPPLF